MAESNSTLSAFKALWDEAVNQQEDLQSVEIEDFDTSIRLDPILQQLFRLADRLQVSNTIDSTQYDQMHSAILTLKGIIESVDPSELSNALESLE